MNRRIHAKYFKASMTQKSGWSKSLKTEDKVLFGIALFVGASAITLVTVGDFIWNRVSKTAKTHQRVQDSFEQFDRNQDDFSQSLKSAVTAFEGNHQMINEAHAAHMKHLGSSTDSMQDAFDEHMEAMHKLMDANWNIIKQDALKRITAPMIPFEEAKYMSERQ